MTTDWKRLVAHPIALVFPEIDADTFNDLVSSMRTTGYQADHPIVLFEGKILDGRNRHRAALQAKVEPTLREFDGDTAAAISFCIGENVYRRHLTPAQRAIAVEEMLRFLPVRAPGRPSAEQNNCASSAQLRPVNREVAAKAHVSPRTQLQVRELKRIAPEMLQGVKQGRQSLPAALRKAKAAAAPPKPAVELDDAGRCIHPAAREALTTERAKFAAIVRAVRAAKRDAKTLAQSEAGRLLRWDALETDFNNLTRMLHYAAPYTSCPMGDPCDDQCALCGGTQWISESQWASVPREYKK